MQRIHIITQSTPGDGYIHGTVALWLDTPATLQVADATRTSAVPWATTPELQAIQAGTVTEVVATAKVPLTDPQTGTPLTVAQINGLIQANGQAALPAQQAALNASAPPARWVGATYDDATQAWSNMPS